ncbi:MAG: response regulator [Chitinophagales bacterium]
MSQKILVVDDQKGVRRLLEELFVREGYQVTIAVDGKESLEIVKNDPPDIILMDMKMPNMSGLEASQEILNINPNMPIILMTAYGEMEVVQRALELGVKRYITKPFDIVVMRNLVKEILSERRPL